MEDIGDPILNVSSRFAAVSFNGQRVAGFNNIELITDRPLEVNYKKFMKRKKVSTSRNYRVLNGRAKARKMA